MRGKEERCSQARTIQEVCIGAIVINSSSSNNYCYQNSSVYWFTCELVVLPRTILVLVYMYLYSLPLR